jgi:RNA polymerase sigma-70 factor (ECF subfamily)
LSHDFSIINEGFPSQKDVTQQVSKERGDMDYSKLSEGDLLKKCLRGDGGAWDAFVIKFSKLIYHTLYQTFKAKNIHFDSHLADDLYQEVYLSLYKSNFKKLRQFKGKNNCSLASWLRMIASRTAIDFMRSHKSHISVESAPIDENDPIDTLSNGRELPDKSIERLEWYQLLRRLIEALSPKDRYLFELWVNQELPDKEIAQILNLSIEAIYMRKNRLKEKLKTIINKKKIS